MEKRIDHSGFFRPNLCRDFFTIKLQLPRLKMHEYVEGDERGIKKTNNLYSSLLPITGAIV